MRSVRNRETQMFGYLIDRVDRFEGDGSLQSRSYEIHCIRTGTVVGLQPSLRAARRWVVLRELGGFAQAKKRERERSEVRVA
jgi:DNA-binding sugar fermentation-stimulating protein